LTELEIKMKEDSSNSS